MHDPTRDGTPAARGHAPAAEMPCLACRNALLLAIAMEKPPLPMNTVLDGPERDPLLDDEAVAVLKAVYLRQPQVPEFRARGMSDTEIVDAMHGIAQAGILKIVQRGGGIDLVPPAAGAAAAGLESPTASRVRQQQKAKRRQRRRQFRR
jgi:hypothetical protein